MELVADHNSKHMFTWKQLAMLIAPLVVEQILTVTVGVADSVMVSGEGEAALSAVSLVDSLNNLILVILSSLATGGAVVCSQYLGHRQPEEARKAAGQLLLANVGLATILTVFMLIFGRSLLTLLFGEVETDVMDAALDYYIFIVLCYPFLAAYNSGAAIQRSLGNSGTSMKIALLMNAVNLAGNAILIYACGLGVTGAAIATFFSRIVGGTIIVAIMHDKSKSIYFEKIHKLRPNYRVIRKILSIGVPTATENSIFQLGKVIVSSLISTLGTAAIMGHSVASQLCMFMIIPGNAVSLGLITIVGQCVGAGRIDEVRRYTKVLICGSVLFNTAVGIVIYAACPLLLGFYNMSGESVTIATTLCLWHVIAGLIWPTAFNTPHCLRAANDARFTMTASMASMWIVRVGGSYALVLWAGLGVYGVWIAMFADWAVRSILFIWRLKGDKWHSRKLIDD